MKLFLGSIYTIVSISLITGLISGLGGTLYFTHFDMMLIGVEASAIIATIFVVLWGVPTHILFRKFRKYTKKWYALSGFLAGPLFVFVAQPFGDDLFLDKLIQSIYCGVIGVAGAMVFWFFVVKDKGDNK